MTRWNKAGPVPAILQGGNMRAWNGAARADQADYRFRDGDHAYMGGPPHEPQGWYGLFDSDSAMLATGRGHAAHMCLGLTEPCRA